MAAGGGAGGARGPVGPAPEGAWGAGLGRHMTEDAEVRIDLLTRLAEQAMTDAAFRAEARDDLLAALAAHGYDLNPREMALVTRFRATLEEAGIDLFLAHPPDKEQLAALLGR